MKVVTGGARNGAGTSSRQPGCSAERGTRCRAAADAVGWNASGGARRPPASGVGGSRAAPKLPDGKPPGRKAQGQDRPYTHLGMHVTDRCHTSASASCPTPYVPRAPAHPPSAPTRHRRLPPAPAGYGYGWDSAQRKRAYRTAGGLLPDRSRYLERPAFAGHIHFARRPRLSPSARPLPRILQITRHAQPEPPG